MKSVVRFAALAAAIALLLGPAPRAAAADPFDVYVIAPLTGSNAFSAKDARDGLNALQTSVNATGGIRGRSLNFVYLDTQSSPQMAVQLTNQILPKHPSLIIGDVSVAGCNAMSRAVEERTGGVLPLAGVPAGKGRLHVHDRPLGDRRGEGHLAQFARARLEPHRAARRQRCDGPSRRARVSRSCGAAGKPRDANRDGRALQPHGCHGCGASGTHARRQRTSGDRVGERLAVRHGAALDERRCVELAGRRDHRQPLVRRAARVCGAPCRRNCCFAGPTSRPRINRSRTDR